MMVYPGFATQSSAGLLISRPLSVSVASVPISTGRTGVLRAYPCRDRLLTLIVGGATPPGCPRASGPWPAVARLLRHVRHRGGPRVPAVIACPGVGRPASGGC